MSRFDAPDEPEILSECVGCGAELFDGQEIVVWEGEHFCDLDCVAGSLDVRYKTLDKDEL